MGKHDNLISFVGKPDDAHKDMNWTGINRIAWMDDSLIPGSLYFEIMWFTTPREPGPPPHTHDFDEIIGFIGGDPDNPGDLGGEARFMLEGEWYTFTRSGLIFIPAGMEHSPMHIVSVDRPFIHFSGGPSKGTYDKKFTE